MAIKDILGKARRRNRSVGDKFSVVQSIYDRMGSIRDKSPISLDKFYLRASGLGYLCAREEVISHKHSIERTDVIEPKLDFIFSIGHKLHDIVQEVLADILLGNWKCISCSKVFGDNELIKKPKICDYGDCKSTEFEYYEVTLLDEENGIGGHPDGVIEIDREKVLLEFKTCNEQVYTSLSFKGPSKSYIMQVNIYMSRLALTTAFIVYINKNNSDMKEFVIKRDEDLIYDVLKMAKSIKEGIQTGELPERTVCDSIDSYRAKRCPVKKICFGVNSV